MNNNINILIVDERSEIRSLFKSILKRSYPDVQVNEACHVDSGISLIKAVNFDCILLEFQLSDSIGMQFLRQVKVTSPEIPIVMITDYEPQSVAKETCQTGADAFIVKRDLSARKFREVFDTVLEDRLKVTESRYVQQEAVLSFEGLEGLKILIVDDSPTIRSLLTRIFKNKGLDIFSANSGEEAINIALETAPDLILMDVMMPGIDGFETCRRLKSNETTKEIPVIFITASSHTKGAVKCFEVGGLDYIRKPFSKEEVLARARTRLQLREATKKKDAVIEQLKVVSRTLENKEAYLKNITENLTDGLVTINELGVIKSFNFRAEEMFGYSSQDVIGKNLRILVPKLYKNGHDDYISGDLETDKPNVLSTGFEVAGRKKDGTIFPLELGLSEIMADGKRNFVGLLHDITKRKQAEVVINRFSKALNNTFTEIYIFDSESLLFNYVNHAALKNLGYTMNELSGMSPIDIKTDMSWESFSNIVEPLRTEAKENVVFMSYHQRKDGTTYPVEVRLLLLKADADEVFFAIAEDITVRKESEIRLKMEKENAEKANRAKSEFLSRMSHDLRTPLNAILGFAQLLEMDPEDSLKSAQIGNVKRILKSGNYLLDIINQILDLASIEEGTVFLKMEQIEIDDLLNELVSLTRPLAFESGIRLYGNENSSGMRVMADRTRLMQVLLNLITNAIKYNEKDGEINISIEVLGNKTIRVTVADTGPGIPEDRQHGLFEPFNRLGAEQTSIKGVGIGLSIAKQLIEKMDGKIGFKSVQNEGSSFYVELPAYVTNQAEKQGLTDSEAANESVPTNKSLSRTYTILYVDDNLENLEVVRQTLLAREDVKLITAKEALPGIDMARKYIPDLILLDINLPGMNGIEAIKLLKEYKETSMIPVFAISADVLKSDISKAMKAGFKEYIAKPINIIQMLEKIDAVLN